MRRLASICALIAMCAVAAPAANGAPALHGAGVASARSVRVVRCRTEFGVAPGNVAVPSRLVVRGSPRSTAGLVAYTNTNLFLIGPAHMACSGEVGADGNSTVLVWQRGQGSPRPHSHGRALSLTLDPACAFCRAVEACPFFPSFASKLGFPCTSRIPRAETVTYLSPHAYDFVDPPGVRGDGWPSGGHYPADGVVGITRKYEEVYRSTCTLSARKGGTCAVSLNDVLARYG